MSLPTFSSARDEILALFKAAWDTGSPAYNGGTVVPVEWPGIEGPDHVHAFARIAVTHVTSDQTTFGRNGERRFTRTGLVFVQIFTSLSDKTGLGKAEGLAVVARNAFEGVGTDSGLWFRSVRINEIGPDGEGWFQFNVVANFSYDEQR